MPAFAVPLTERSVRLLYRTSNWIGGFSWHDICACMMPAARHSCATGYARRLVCVNVCSSEVGAIYKERRDAHRLTALWSIDTVVSNRLAAKTPTLAAYPEGLALSAFEIRRVTGATTGASRPRRTPCSPTPWAWHKRARTHHLSRCCWAEGSPSASSARRKPHLTVSANTAPRGKRGDSEPDSLPAHLLRCGIPTSIGRRELRVAATHQLSGALH